MPGAADRPVAGRTAQKFDEDFAIIDSHLARWQLGRNPWEREDRCIASLDFAKREEIMPELLRAPDWDLVIIDEAHKCSAVSRWDPIEQRERLDRTRRYALAEELSRRSERLLLTTATPHSGDRSRFLNFLKLLDPDQFSVEQLAAEQIGRDDSPYFLRREHQAHRRAHRPRRAGARAPASGHTSCDLDHAAVVRRPARRPARRA